MPISLENSSNIRVTYNTGSNYIIETVKSDMYVRGTTSGNLSSEPTVSPSIRTANIVVESFTYTTGTTHTTYTKDFSVDTICDILIVGGGGGGGGGHGGGGGAGQLVLIHQAVLNGTYTIKVGKGGNGTILADATTISGATRGGNSEFGSVIAEGGGANGGSTLKDGGSGAGGDGYTDDGGVAGKGLKNTTIDTFSSGIVYSRGNDGGDGGIVGGGGQGGGGGGAGAVGTTGGNSVNSTIGHGGDGLSGISVISYDFKTNFGNYGKLETDGNYWFAGGGAGGIYYNTNGAVSNGGKGGGGSTPPNVAAAKNNGGSGVNGTGGGGAGGSAFYGNGGSGGSGIVIIRYRSLAAAPTSVNMIKTLNFNYYPSLSPTIYTLTFNTRTLATINNGSDKLLNGSYTITLGNTLSTIVPTTANQNLQDTKYSSSTISVSYHLLNPILDTRGAQWTYSSSNANVYHLGSVGIGTTSPEYSLDVRGNIFTSVGGYTQTGSENWIIQSDRRIKENIVKASYDKCLDNIKKIELYNFNFKENYVNTNDRNQLGFIAQEVQEVYPKAIKVITNDKIEELLTLNTTQIKYTLYGAVKSLIEKVENLEMRVDKLYKIAIPDVDIIEIFESTSNISIITSNISTSNLTTNLSNIDKR
jgi:hypothetical protein